MEADNIIPQFVVEEAENFNYAKEKFLLDKSIENRIAFKMQIMNMYSVINAVWSDGIITSALADELRYKYYWRYLDEEFF